jgi:hypothetical protein
VSVWGEDVIAKALLHDPIGDVNALYMAGFPPFAQIELRKAALDVFTRQRLPANFGDVPHGVGFKPLDGLFPGDPAHSSPESGVQIIYIGDLGKIIARILAAEYDLGYWDAVITVMKNQGLREITDKNLIRGNSFRFQSRP